MKQQVIPRRNTHSLLVMLMLVKFTTSAQIHSNLTTPTLLMRSCMISDLILGSLHSLGSSPWMTMEFHVEARDNALAGDKLRLEELRGNMTADQITAAEAYIAEMENLYTKYDGVEPFMIGFPDNPMRELIEDYDYNEDPDGLLLDEATDGE